MDEIIFFVLIIAGVINFWYLLIRFAFSIESFQLSRDATLSKVDLEQVTLGILGVGITLLLLSNWLPEWLVGIAPELIGIAVTVLIIERLVERRNQEQRKQEIIEQIYSPVRDVAVEALRLTRKNGWFDDINKEDFIEVHWEGANLREASLDGASMMGANLEGANLIDASLDSTWLFGANLKGADLWNASLTRAHLNAINLEGACLRAANLDEANLEGAILAKADLNRATFILTNLFEANLEGADLRGANLIEANLEESLLENAIYDNETLWPSDFSPVQAGAINVAENA